jgi:hypothetical protein
MEVASSCETWYIYANLHGVISEETGIFITKAIRRQRLSFLSLPGPYTHNETTWKTKA